MASKRFLVLFRTVPGDTQPPSPGEMADMMPAFMAWQTKYTASIVDMGAKLKHTGRVRRRSGVTDGPFAEAKELVGGYMLLAAENYDEALQVMIECPGILSAASSFEIREIAARDEANGVKESVK